MREWRERGFSIEDGSRLVWINCDFCDLGEVKEVGDGLMKRLGRLDVLVIGDGMAFYFYPSCLLHSKGRDGTLWLAGVEKLED